MRAKILGTAAGLAMTLAAGGVAAETIRFDRQVAGDIFAGGGRETVSTSATGQTSILAGGFRLQDANDAARKFVAWCVELADTLQLPWDYSSNDTLFSASVRDNLVRLFNTAYDQVDLSNNAQSAGFQLAIWEIIEEGSGSFDLSGGTFTASASAAALAAGQSYLDGLGDAAPETYRLTFWEAATTQKGSSQNLITVAPIPLPMAAWMLLGALAATAAVTRVRRNA